jgi:hypothetical protein
MRYDSIRRLAEGDERVGNPRSALLEVLGVMHSDLDFMPITDHPLGFLHFELSDLAQLSGGIRLRLHVWEEGSHGPDELGLYHDHTWALRSLVLEGGLQDSVYSVDYNPLGSTEEVMIQYGSDVHRTTKNRRVDLQLLASRQFHAGARYTVDAGQVHATTTLLRPTVTLVLTSPTLSKTARVFAPPGGFVGGPSTRPSVSPNEASARLARVLCASSEA